MSRMPGNLRGLEYFKQAGTELFEAWYYASQVNAIAPVTGVPSNNTLYALPFVSPRGGALDRIAFRCVTGVASSVARVGIYTAFSETNLYPYELICDGGQKTPTVNATSHTSVIDVRLEAGRLYWFVYVGGTATPTIRCLALAGCYPILSGTNAFNATPQIGWLTTFTYAALPSRYPIDYTSFLSAVPIPAIACRFAS